MTSRKEELKKEVPDIVIDPATNKRYNKGKFLGKGGFARCYELIDVAENRIYAGKIVPKSMIAKQHQREKMTQEINIHRSVFHKHIVGFESFFEDSENVYVLLELCRRRSLMELHKRRRAISEPEARYFTYQVVLACDYLHKRKIIHRDLKLGNLFLSDDMEIKIGDFGLATRIDYDGERKRTLCGTPNYIAPEILGKKGHSYEVDAWSLGCIIYTLLVGKPPFETSCLKDTYNKIKRNEYFIPSNRVSSSAKNLIQKLLASDPTQRPTMEMVLKDDFFTCGFLPKNLPLSCLTMAPRFDAVKMPDSRKPLLELNGMKAESSGVTGKEERGDGEMGASGRPDSVRRQDSDKPTDYYLNDLYQQLQAVMVSKPNDKGDGELKEANDGDNEDPASVPVFWVSKWVDYSDKYGLGYQLSDNSVGVLYNDSTRLLLMANGETTQYIERDGREFFYTIKAYPELMTKKVTLLKYFRNYMSEHLLKAGANMTPRESDDLSRLPFLRDWFRTRSAIVLHLSNGTLQINFFQDHTKIILCPLMGAVTYLDEKQEFRTFRLSQIEQNGCSKELASRLRYARTMVERLLQTRSGSARAGSARAKSAAT